MFVFPCRKNECQHCTISAEKAPIVCLLLFINKKSCHSFCVGCVSPHCSLFCPASPFTLYVFIPLQDGYTVFRRSLVHFAFIRFSRLQSPAAIVCTRLLCRSGCVAVIVFVSAYFPARRLILALVEPTFRYN